MALSFETRTIEELAAERSRKWSAFPGTIGMWVAEMDFGISPEIRDYLISEAHRGSLGYLRMPSTQRRHYPANLLYRSQRPGGIVDKDKLGSPCGVEPSSHGSLSTRPTCNNAGIQPSTIQNLAERDDVVGRSSDNTGVNDTGLGHGPNRVD